MGDEIEMDALVKRKGIEREKRGKGYEDFVFI